MIALSAVMVIGFSGCGNSEVNEVVVERNSTEVDSGSMIVLEDNQTIGYKPNTDVNIVNIGDNSYYIECSNGSCPINIDNSVATDGSTTETNYYYESNETNVSA